MPEAVMVALVTGGLVVLSGLVATLGQMFGPAWHERSRRRIESREQKAAAQVVAAVTFLQALSDREPGWSDRRAKSRALFLGTLPPERLTPGIMDYTGALARPRPERDLSTIEAADWILGWLHGSVPDEALSALSEGETVVIGHAGPPPKKIRWAADHARE